MAKGLKVSYPIFIGAGTRLRLPQWVKRHHPNRTVVIISDSTVMHLYGRDLVSQFKRAKAHVVSISFPAGEKSKTHTEKQRIERQMFEKGCGRDSIVIALGGGVTGDLAGYVAATYMRGLPYIQVPTTLLAMVDSSIGGKTGVDTDYGKNLVGAFWQPKAVFADTDCLRTLPQAHIVNGLVEALKMFLTHDAKAFHSLMHQIGKAITNDSRVLTSVIRRAVAIKAGVVARDEKESNERMVLNLGHTVGHALEYMADYRMLHGVAVALGILVEAKAAELMGVLSEDAFSAIETLLQQLNISPKQLKNFDVQKMLKAMRLDKKVQVGTVRYVILEDIGRVHQVLKSFAHPIPDALIRKAYKIITGG